MEWLVVDAVLFLHIAPENTQSFKRLRPGTAPDCVMKRQRCCIEVLSLAGATWNHLKWQDVRNQKKMCVGTSLVGNSRVYIKVSVASSNKLGAWGQSWISKAHGFHISGSGRLLSCLAFISLVSSKNSSMTTALRKFIHEISSNNRHHLAPPKKKRHSKNCMHSSFHSNSDNLILGPIAWSIHHESWLQIVIEALTDPSVHYKTLALG